MNNVLRILAYILMAPFFVFECSGLFVSLYYVFPLITLSQLLAQAVVALVLAYLGYTLHERLDVQEWKQEQEDATWMAHLLAKDEAEEPPYTDNSLEEREYMAQTAVTSISSFHEEHCGCVQCHPVDCMCVQCRPYYQHGDECYCLDCRPF